MSRAVAIVAFAVPFFGLPGAAWLMLPGVPEPQVLELERDEPCPTVSQLRRRLAQVQTDDEQVSIVDEASDELWDIPDPIFGKPTLWPDPETLPAHLQADGFQRLMTTRAPEGVSVDFDCSEYPCFAMLKVPEPVDGDPIPGFVEEICAEFECASRFTQRSGGVVYGALISLADVDESNDRRHHARYSVLQYGLMFETPEWISEPPTPD